MANQTLQSSDSDSSKSADDMVANDGDASNSKLKIVSWSYGWRIGALIEILLHV